MSLSLFEKKITLLCFQTAIVLLLLMWYLTLLWIQMNYWSSPFDFSIIWQNTWSNFMASHCHVSRLMLVSSWMMKLLRFWLSCFSKIALLVYMCICTFEWSSLCIFILFILWLTCIHFIQTGTTHLMPQLLPI